MQDIMIDIKTLALTPDATILSIGAVKFDKTSMGDEFYFELKPDQGRHIDPSTALWWAQQSSAFDDGLVKYGLLEVLKHLNGFMDESYLDDFDRKILTGDFKGRVWANPPSFDLAIIEHAYAQHDIECMWDFRQERDVRTVKSLLESNDKFHNADINSALPIFDGRKHNALDDARHQARIIQRFLAGSGLEL